MSVQIRQLVPSDYLLQHSAKLLVELGEFAAARDRLSQALSLRQKLRRPVETIASTREAIEALDKLIERG